jgi:hypothetical protein
MNISLSEEGKQMSFKVFVDTFGKHFKTFADPEKEMKSKYVELTGKDVNVRAKRKKSKVV